MRFFLQGVAVTADNATDTALAVAKLHASDLRMTSEFAFGKYGLAFVDLISQQPVVTVAFVSEQLGSSPTTAGLLLGKATDAGMIEEITGRKRNWILRHSRLLDLFSTDEGE